MASLSDAGTMTLSTRRRASSSRSSAGSSNATLYSSAADIRKIAFDTGTRQAGSRFKKNDPESSFRWCLLSYMNCFTQFIDILRQKRNISSICSDKHTHLIFLADTSFCICSRNGMACYKKTKQKPADDNAITMSAVTLGVNW